MGKTRLAIEVARRAADEGAEVTLAEVTDGPDEAVLRDAVARALGIGRDEGIGQALRARGEVVLVLDGIDRAAGAAGATIAAWLANAPELFVLVASRARTHVAGEVVHELLPLPQAEAEELFVACARRIRAGWTPGEADREPIAAIAREVEGAPLAIELAAARISVMGTRAILHRLRGGAPGAGVIDRVIEGSWNALDEAERRALAQVSVFHGGFALDSAEHVLDAGRDAVDVVTALREKSLLFAREDAHGEVRLDAYRAIRTYAARKLDETAGARAHVEQRHADHFAALAERLGVDRTAEARARLLAERDNLLAVVERAVKGGAETLSASAAQPVLRVLLALAPVLLAHGPLAAYEVLVDPAIARTRGSGADPRLVAQVLVARGAIHRHRGAAAEGARDLVQALGIARTVADRATEGRALVELGHALWAAADLAGAEAHFRDAARLFAASDEAVEAARATVSLAGVVARSGRADEARASLERARETKDPTVRAEALLRLGALDAEAGQLAAARASLEDSLRASRASGDERGAALAEVELGRVAERAGERALARASYERAASRFAELGHGALVADAEARLIALAGAPGTAPPEDALLVAEAGGWFRPPGAPRVSLERRKPLARIAERLASERLERPGAPLTSRALQDAAWPGEKILSAAGAHRVRVAVSTLRKLGLAIVTLGEGYALDPAVPCVRA
jgi:predicted ATPase